MRLNILPTQANGIVLPKQRQRMRLLQLIIAFALFPVCIYAQGVTTGSIAGSVTNDRNEALPGAIVSAIHTTSGSKYFTATHKDGNFNLQSVRVGGPYTIIISYTGYETDTIKNAQVTLGGELNLQVTLQVKSTRLAALTVSARRNNIMTSDKTGAGNVVNKNQMSSLPTISRSINDFTRLTPEAGGNGMLGKGGKSNNVSIDGAAFNNTFGLGLESANMPGANANAQPISLDAIEQISVDLSPYDVKQGGFTGAGVNAVTRSGDNEFRGSVYYFFRNQQLISQQVDDIHINRTDFNEHTVGFRIGGPIIKNKLFFFGNYEEVKSTQPGAAYIAGRNGSNGSNVSNISAGSLDTLAGFLKSAYNYNPGQYENYNIPIENRKFLIKLDWNINDKHKASLRYNQLTSSSSFGATSSLNAIGYSNNGFIRSNNIYSATGELNSTFSNRISNRFFTSYTSMPDYRDYFGELFPVVNINDNGRVYTFGTNNAARNNRVDQQIAQFQDDISVTANKHKLSAGISFQYFNFGNDFTLNPQGTYTFNSLSSFYNAAPAGTSTPLGASTGLGLPSAYSLNYTVQPGRAVTHVNTKMSQTGVYLQDEFFATKALKLTGGLRLDIISFIGSPVNNETVEPMTFQDEMGRPTHFSTHTSPGTKALLSPRIGFNWALNDSRSMQLRGGTGIFTGNIPFTYISARFNNNGLNEGSIVANNAVAAANYPFNPAPAYYKPANGAANATYEIDLVTPNFKLPQTWRSTLGIDWKLPNNFVAGFEGIYSKDLNAPFYQNVNLNSSTTTTATDGRLQYTSNRINPTITGAYLLKNISMGRQYFLTASLNRQFSNGWFSVLSYTYGNSKDGFNFNSTTPAGAFNSLPVVGNSNMPVMAYSMFDLRHRIVASSSYKITYLKNRMSTSIGVFFEASQQGRGSYTYGGTGDVNKDGVTSNDLIYVPKDISQINLVASSTATVDEQWSALNKYIGDSKYLSSRRGQFAERNGVLFPWYYQADVRIIQDLNAFLGVHNKKHTLEFTADILNVTNLLNSHWGVYKIMANTSPITAVNANTFQVNPALLQKGEFTPDTNLSSAINPSASSRYRIQLGIRYSFN